MREKYGVCDDWVLPFQVVPIIHIPDFGDTSAVKVCEDLKIKSNHKTTERNSRRRRV